MKKLILIDSNALVHRAFHALPPTMSSPQGVPTNAVYGFTSVFLKMLKDLKPDYIIATFDLAGPTFRHEEFADYKAHRVKGPDGLYEQIPIVKEILTAFGVPIFTKEGYEADDLIGSLSHLIRKNKDIQTVIVTGDMDTLQLVQDDKVVVFTLRKGVTDTITYNEDMVRERYGLEPEQMTDYKGLKGDPSDNIPGVPGIGDKTATTLVQQFGSIEKLYAEIEKGLEKDKKKGLSEKLVQKLKDNKDQAIFSKRLATIVCDLDLDFDLEKSRWRDNVNLPVLENLMKTYGFYSLMKRVPEAMGEMPVVEQSSLFSEESAPVHDPEPILTKTELIGHQLKNYVKKLMDGQMPVPHEIFDTAIASWLIHPDSKSYDYSRIWTEAFGSQAHATPAELKQLKQYLSEQIDREELTSVFKDIEMPLIPVLAQMERYGIAVDVKMLSKLLIKTNKELADLEKEIYDLAGGPFNINSPQQLSEVLYQKLNLKGRIRRTGGGALSTAASELEKLRHEHPIINLILNYRELQKLKTTYIEPFPTLIGEDERIHTTYNQAGTGTGRLSSQDPNLQNIPIRTELGQEFRKAFIARGGYQLASFDYSQLELRLVAHIAQDKKMIEAFNRGEDIHTRTAVEIFGVAPEDVTKDMRRQAKVLNFGLVYGMGTLGFAAAAGVDRNQAREFIDRYFNEFTGVAEYMRMIREKASRDGYVKTIFGRKRALPDIHSGMPQLQAQAERMAINHPVQGTGADIIKLAMIQIHDYISKHHLEDSVRMLLQVHDELVFEIKEDEIKKHVPEIKKIMENVHPLAVPLTVDVKCGDNWAQTQPFKS